MPLTDEFIQELLQRELAGTRKSKPPQAKRRRFTEPQVGPLRWYDTEMRCAFRGCGSSTYIKLKGIPRCYTHALKEMNQIFVEMGITE